MKSTEEEGLDNIFKQGLKEPGHIADYREGDWDALEQMLDEKEKKRPIILWLRIASGIAAMLLLGFGWLYLHPGTDTGNTKQPLNTRVIKKDNNSTTHTGTVAPAKPVTESSTLAITAHQDHTGTSGGSKHQTAGGSSNNKSSVEPAHILAMRRPAKKDNSFFTLSGPAARRDTAGLVNNAMMNRNNTEVLAALNGRDIQQAQLSGKADFKQPLFREITSTPEEFRDRIAGVNKRHAQFAITVLASPSINGVGSFSQAQVGSNLGLVFSMGVSKFTFSTGAIYAKTPYTANASSYTIAYPSKFTPDNVSADCRVLDIPLNIDYQVYSKANNAFCIGSGLSSYIMLKENYQYSYNSPYAGYYPQGFSVTNQNRYFFGVLNLDATYQRKLNAKLSFDVQPYLKIPLTGIGAGDVKLQTFGVALGLKWNLNRIFKP
jgi:hypothetical protein